MAPGRTPHLHRPRREWGPALLCCSLLVWVAISVVFASRLSGMKRFGAFKGDLSWAPEGGPAPGPQHTQAAETPPQPQPPLPRPNAGFDAAITTAQPSPKAAVQGTAADGEDVRVSGLGPALDDATLHGGWRFTWEDFDLPTKHPNATVVSWHSPRALHIRDFLQPDEVALLIEAASAGFQRSEVVADTHSLDDSRTSYGAWLNGPRRTAKVREIQDRIYQLTHIPEEFGESLYVLRYATGQKYEAHTDHCHHAPGEELTASCRGFLARAGGPACGPGGGGVTCGDRLATLILYLQSPKRGGATVFPHAKNYHLPASVKSRVEATEIRRRQQLDAGDDARQAAKGTAEAAAPGAGADAGGDTDIQRAWYCQEDAEVLKVLPRAGDAVLFYDYTPGEGADGLAQADPSSLHAGCPPLEGTKLIATRWMRSAEFH